MTAGKPSTDTATALAAFFLMCCGWLIFANVFRGTGWDYAQFYIAGSIPIHSIYDRAVFEEFARDELEPQGTSYFPPYVRPAVFALPSEVVRSVAVLRGAGGVLRAPIRLLSGCVVAFVPAVPTLAAARWRLFGLVLSRR